MSYNPYSLNCSSYLLIFDGTLLWKFNYYISNYLSYNHIEPITNGNVLTIASEYKTRNDTINVRLNPNSDPNSFFPGPYNRG